MADRSFLAWPFFEDAHRALAEELERFAKSEILPLSHRGGDDASVDALSQKFVRLLGENGFLRYCVPKAYGGRKEGLDVRSLCLCREILARHSGLADFAFAMQGLGSAPISLFGSDELKERYLPGVAGGGRIAAFAISESDSGSDVGAMKTTATKEGRDYILNGSKTWISNAGIADQYVVFARTGEGPGTKGISAFVVNADNPGLRTGERISVIAPHPLGTLEFTACRVPESDMLGRPGEGFKVGMATLDVFRSTVGAAALGLARRALDEALARVGVREVFGRKLSQFQLTQAKIADMAVSVDASALLVYRAAWTKDILGTRVSREAAMAKLYATESAQQVIDQAVQLFGGLGVVSGVPVEELYREIRALRIYEGTSEVMKLVIASNELNET
ncbi:MAG: acyl-CoA dehydrogenase family protein [Nitrospinota bacterium]